MMKRLILISVICFIAFNLYGQKEGVLYFQVDGKKVIIPDSNFYSYSNEGATFNITCEIDSFYMFCVNEKLHVTKIFFFKDKAVQDSALKIINSKVKWFLLFKDEKTNTKFTFYQFKFSIYADKKVKINKNRKVRSYIITQIS